MSGTGRHNALLFVPIIKGIEYKFELNGNNITSITISGQSIPLNQINADLYLEIDREVRKFNNVFVLFGVVASNNNGKIKMQITLNPCDYVRGLVFEIDANLLQQGKQISQIFDNCDRFEISKGSFAILNRNNDIGNSDKILICIARDTYTGYTELVNINEDDIKVFKDNQRLNIKDVKIFKHSTPRG